MRRRAPARREPTGLDGLPEPLLRCVVEDWVTPSSVPDGPDFGARIVLSAHGAWRAAQAAWADANGVPLRDVMRAARGGPPLFRDEVAFVEASWAR